MTNDVLLIILNTKNEQSKLAQSLGEEKALEINEKLEAAACAAIAAVSCRKIVLHTDEDVAETIWSGVNFTLKQQTEKYVNDKLKSAFANYIIQDKDDVNKVVFVAADCPLLTQQIIEKAFESLNKYDVCIGPEKKGSYYLIGMKEPLPFLFDNKLWSSKHLLDDTLEELIEHGKNYFLLPELQRVNDIYDLHLVK
jgi:glycosyltransferase A (GT-A) superfamily protein (DUF2064 family)